jgi:hypothetical protein
VTVAANSRRLLNPAIPSARVFVGGSNREHRGSIEAEIRWPWCAGCKSSSDPVTESLVPAALPWSPHTLVPVSSRGILRRAPGTCSVPRHSRALVPAESASCRPVLVPPVSSLVSALTFVGNLAGACARWARRASRTLRSFCVLLLLLTGQPRASAALVHHAALPVWSATMRLSRRMETNGDVDREKRESWCLRVLRARDGQLLRPQAHNDVAAGSRRSRRLLLRRGLAGYVNDPPCLHL